MSAVTSGLLLVGLVTPAPLSAQFRQVPQLTTAERVLLPGWWPTKEDSSRADYVGPRVCASCHASEAGAQDKTAMASAGVPVSKSAVLLTRPSVHARIDPYEYEILRQGGRTIYTVRHATRTVSVSLLYAFGVGNVGQTYVFERGGAYYESRVSFFPEIGLDITIGHLRTFSGTIEEALGRRMGAEESRRCFACHTTAAVTDNRLEPRQMIPGVTCEACHGPGAKHVAGIKAGQFQQTFIFNPSKLSPADSTDFCGACHRTSMDVKLLQAPGVQTVRFQPYRLERSRCWARSGRMTCLSCHDPHEPLVRDAASYDSKCLTCHLSERREEPTQDRAGIACPIKTRDCVSCHMPKLRMPGARFEFTDHQIRVVKPGEAFPS